jgi:uncharacterized membrane protein
MALAVLSAVALQVILPHRQRFPAFWLFPVAEIVMLLTLIVGDPGRIDRTSTFLRRLTIALIALMTAATIVAGIGLIRDIIVGAHLTPTQLLGRGAAIWFTNVIAFSLWYWQLDRGGPAERAAGSGVRPSFAFPENATPELAPPDWMPTYPDYLYLAFTNSTAFSPTDTLPVATWAKMTMIVQSALSLVIGLLVIARAVNVLP